MRIVRISGPGKKQLDLAIKNMTGKVAKVGWMKGVQYYPEQTSVAQVAMTQEFGDPAKNIPSRPFMRITIANKKNIWSNIIEKSAMAIIKGKITISQAMEIIGLKAAGDSRKTLTQIKNPPLSPITIQARLHRRADKNTIGNLTQPLVDTGLMLNTLTNSVEDEE